MKLSVRRRNLLRSSALAALLIAGVASNANAADPTYQFNIPAESLSQALTDFSQASSQQIIYTEDLVRGRKSTGLHGTYTAEQALDALLAGTDLKIQVNAAGVMMVQQKNVQAASNEAAPPSSIETVTVTGTRISGTGPTGSIVSVYTHDQMQQSGSATLDQFARQIPQNFSNVDFVSNAFSNAGFATGIGSGANSFAGAGINLHGLGTSSTLVLLNGQRIAPGGFDGSLVDISLIPLSAVDRMEVLPDGASAIYGADAVAGVVNIITRNDFDGVETSLRYGGATDGGATEFNGSQLFGKAWATGNVLVDYEYDNQGGLDASQRDYIPNRGGPFDLIPPNHRNSLFASASQQLDSDTAISGVALFSRREFSQAQTANGSLYSTQALGGGHAQQFELTGDLARKFGDDWTANLNVNIANLAQASDVATTYSGLINLTTREGNTATSRNWEADVTADGSLATLPGGELKTALGASYRRESFVAQEVLNGNPYKFGSIPSLDRAVWSAYGELFFPLLESENGVDGVTRLEFSAAARYDHYSDFGSTTNPKLGLLYSPLDGVTFRGTYGTSFQTPLLSQIGQPNAYSAQLAPDPLSGTGFSDVLLLNGGNSQLKPETSRSLTASFEIDPPSVSGLSIVASYFNIDFRNRIATPQLPLGTGSLLTDPSLASFVSRNPALSLVQSYFASPAFAGDFAGGGASSVVAIFDDRYANFASTLESGLDLGTSYRIETDAGAFAATANFSGLIKNEFQAGPSATPISLLNMFAQPPRWRGRGQLSWSNRGFAASLAINYTNGYRNSLTTPEQSIGSWTTADLNVFYKTDDTASHVLRGLTFDLSVQNLTDARPPFVAIPGKFLLPGGSALPFDPTNSSPIGRLVSLQITKEW